MTGYLEFYRLDHERLVIININSIVAIEDHDIDVCYIFTTNGDQIRVNTSYDDVKGLIRDLTER